MINIFIHNFYLTIGLLIVCDTKFDFNLNNSVEFFPKGKDKLRPLVKNNYFRVYLNRYIYLINSWVILLVMMVLWLEIVTEFFPSWSTNTRMESYLFLIFREFFKIYI